MANTRTNRGKMPLLISTPRRLYAGDDPRLVTPGFVRIRDSAILDAQNNLGLSGGGSHRFLQVATGERTMGTQTTIEPTTVKLKSLRSLRAYARMWRRDGVRWKVTEQNFKTGELTVEIWVEGHCQNPFGWRG